MDDTAGLRRVLGAQHRTKYKELAPRGVSAERYTSLLKSSEFSELSSAEKYTQTLVWCLSTVIKANEEQTVTRLQFDATGELKTRILAAVRDALVHERTILNRRARIESAEATNLKPRTEHPDDVRHAKTLVVLGHGRRELSVINTDKYALLQTWSAKLRRSPRTVAAVAHTTMGDAQPRGELTFSISTKTSHNSAAAGLRFQRTAAFIKTLLVELRDVEAEADILLSQLVLDAGRCRKTWGR